MTDTNNKDGIIDIIGAIEQLPPMPGVVLNILNIIDDPDTSYNDLVKNVDVAIGVKLLHVANSAFYKTYQNIQSLEHAISILGLNAIKNMLIGINVATILTPDSSDKHSFDYNKFWKHSVLTAQFSRILGKMIRYPELSKVYTIGLIHDMGRLLIAQYYPDKFSEIMNLVETQGMDICSAEEKVIGITHCRIGGKMAEKWKLTPEMMDVITFHSTPDALKQSAEKYRIVVIVNTAEKIINETGTSLTKDLLTKSLIINEFISQMVKSVASHLDEKKILSNWIDIIMNDLGRIEEELSTVLRTLFKFK